MMNSRTEQIEQIEVYLESDACVGWVGTGGVVPATWSRWRIEGKEMN